MNTLGVNVDNIATLRQARRIETPSPASGRRLEPESILPADVLARTKLVLNQLALIRFEMGKLDQKRSPIFRVKDATPREVYFQALTLLRKTNRLLFEQTSSLQLQRDKDISPENIKPYHVWKTVNRSLKRILAVKQALGISKKMHEVPQADATSPSDVFNLLVRVNRSVNLLLDVRFSPAEVFQEVTVAVRYASELLAHFPGSSRIAAEPKLERGKRLSDVLQELRASFTQVQKIIHISGGKGAIIDGKFTEVDEVTPSDVLDIAVLLVSELAYLRAELIDRKSPTFEVYAPGRRFPSHVFQRAGILRAQLKELARYVEMKPHWLKDQ